MIFPKKYKALDVNIFTKNDYTLVPIRYEDRLNIMKWRNEQMYHLRQEIILTEENQENYYKDIISKLFTEKKPNQLLFSFLKNDKCVGYGGLVHIDWENKSSEISFIMNTSLEENYFEILWDKFLLLIEKVAFNDLNLQKISTYAYDIRPHIYKIFEKNGFINKVTLKDKYLFNNKTVDVVIHTKNK